VKFMIAVEHTEAKALHDDRSGEEKSGQKFTAEELEKPILNGRPIPFTEGHAGQPAWQIKS
jgi:hypothetical protein